MLDFDKIKKAVNKRFLALSNHNLFRTAVDGDTMWTQYLLAFPEGTNPVYRERTEHDCSCCRHFIRDIGNVVAIIDGEVVTLWDVQVDDPAYQAVADQMAELVRSYSIRDIFVHREPTVGIDKNYEDASHVVTWSHFHVRLPVRNSGRQFFRAGPDIPTLLGEYRALHDVLLRSLTELTLESVDTVLELVAQNSLYRGQEHKHSLTTFRKLKEVFDFANDAQRDLFVWSKIDEVPAAVSKIRNTSIGTLLIDLSEGLDLEDAVHKYESVVAPTNYKRPTALVTQSMVEAARKAVSELNLSLERRHAVLTDISVNNVIFADRSARKSMKNDVFDEVPTKKSKMRWDQVEVVPIDKFISDIVPNVQSIEVMLENKHAGNLVTLIAPVEKAAPRLFKWDNNFSWAYAGDVADSIKERVKKAGGNVTGDLCCRLAWFNYDDLDLHMKGPGYHIYFGDKKPPYAGGQLDVDMNAGSGQTREPVENIFYSDRHKMREGEYHLFVHQYARRESVDLGFEIEFDYLGDVQRFSYDKMVRDNSQVSIARFDYTHKGGIKIHESLKGAQVSRQLWGLPTQEFHRVNVLMQSPNYWDAQSGVGNRHYFFMLQGCVNDGEARGFFNEFLRNDLDKHRKVIEIVGSRTKVRPSGDQLSGLGFSETKRNEILTKVEGNFTRTLRVLI